MNIVRIEQNDWLPETFARVDNLVDVMRIPSSEYQELMRKEKDAIRQTQVESGEIIRVLGFHEEFALIQKWDKVLGWLQKSDLLVDEGLKDFCPPASKSLAATHFFEYWQAKPYVWGGITEEGIDCSAFTQKYYLDVHDLVLPRNSHDQREFGKSIELDLIDDHDLIFCRRIGGSGRHHVGVYHQNQVWHAHTERGVVSVLYADFREDYSIEAVVRFLSA